MRKELYYKDILVFRVATLLTVTMEITPSTAVLQIINAKTTGKDKP